MSFLYPQLFLLLLLIFWLKRERPTQKQKNCKLSKNSNKNILLLSLIFAIIALSRPVIFNKIQPQKVKTKEIIIALDISYSMQADDIKPNRVTKAKEVIKKIVSQNRNSSFSLFAFTTNPLILCPQTTDHLILLSALESIHEEFILTHGTSLKNLLNHIASLPLKTKNLLIFTDGGDERDLLSLKNIAIQNGIKLFIVGVATQNGTILHDKYGKDIKDDKGNLVITRLNPILKELGEYVDIDKADTIISKIDHTQNRTKERVDIQELFWIPLVISIILFIFASISIPKKLLFLLPFLTTSSEAYILDWYYISQAKEATISKDYQKAVTLLQKIEPSILQQLHLAHNYYKATKYNMALNIYDNLKTTNKHLKKTILFSKANTLAKIGDFQSARDNYILALNLEEDQDIYHNLAIVLKEIKNKKQDLPNPFQKKLHTLKKKEASNKNNKNQGNSKTSNLSGQSSQGLSSQKGKQQEQKSEISSTSKPRPLGYKAYFLINKGYINEKNPW